MYCIQLFWFHKYFSITILHQIFPTHKVAVNTLVQIKLSSTQQSRLNNLSYLLSSISYDFILCPSTAPIK